MVHIAARRPFSQSQVQVYIDGRQKAIAPFKFPNLSEVRAEVVYVHRLLLFSLMFLNETCLFVN